MSSLALSVVLQASLLATGAHEYNEALKQTEETGRPLLILVGADWCPACQTMKQSTMPAVARSGKLGKVAFARVNTDHDGVLARKLMSGGSIPQLVLYLKTETGWSRSQLTGGQSASTVEAFIDRALQTQAAVASKQQKANQASTTKAAE